ADKADDAEQGGAAANVGVRLAVAGGVVGVEDVLLVAPAAFEEDQEGAVGVAEVAGAEDALGQRLLAAALDFGLVEAAGVIAAEAEFEGAGLADVAAV